MATYQRGTYWWYRFRFAGERIDGPTKSTSRTVAKEAERQHRRALEAGYNNFKEVRQDCAAPRESSNWHRCSQIHGIRVLFLQSP